MGKTMTEILEALDECDTRISERVPDVKIVFKDIDLENFFGFSSDDEEPKKDYREVVEDDLDVEHVEIDGIFDAMGKRII